MPDPSRVPEELPKRYVPLSLLGVGGSGRVLRVHDSIRGVELALKIVTPSESIWLRREFDTLRQIRHENLIEVFDWGALPTGDAYYTMELIQGGDWQAASVHHSQPTKSDAFSLAFSAAWRISTLTERFTVT